MNTKHTPTPREAVYSAKICLQRDSAAARGQHKALTTRANDSTASALEVLLNSHDALVAALENVAISRNAQWSRHVAIEALAALKAANGAA